MAEITLEEVRQDPRVKTFIQKANDYLGVLGYTEHGFRHTGLVAREARNILNELDFDQREGELAAIAGYLHDIGNVSGRKGHCQAGALIALDILQSLGMPMYEVAEVISAIGNHDEEDGCVISRVAAALILADKSDVHRSRVRNTDFSTFDIHDRVNYAVESSCLHVNENRVISLELDIDTGISHVMEYFEIFLSRMVMCRRAASYLDARFALVINGAQLL